MSDFPSITELVPHAAPILALKELVHYEPGLARCRLLIEKDELFCVEGAVDSICSIEYMAQAVAACLGQDAWISGDSVRVGMVIACRQLSLERPRLNVGEEFICTAKCVRGTEHASHYDTEMHDTEGKLVASATMTLVHGARPTQESPS